MTTAGLQKKVGKSQTYLRKKSSYESRI